MAELFTEESINQEDEKAKIVMKFVSRLQDVATQLQIWHWNTRDFQHLALGEAYDCIGKSTDSLAEAFITVFETPFEKTKDSFAFIDTFTKSAMNILCKSYISKCNQLASCIDDEGIKSDLGDVIKTLRTLMYKIG